MVFADRGGDATRHNLPYLNLGSTTQQPFESQHTHFRAHGHVKHRPQRLPEQPQTARSAAAERQQRLWTSERAPLTDRPRAFPEPFVKRKPSKTGLPKTLFRSPGESPRGAERPPALKPREALSVHAPRLTEYEKNEIYGFQEIHFVGEHASKVQAPVEDAQYNHGYDDERGDYVLRMRDHLAYRYELLSVLGKGSFGQVVKAYDHVEGRFVAIKIIRNKKRFHTQALVEVRILQRLRDLDPDDVSSSVEMLGHFYFRGHLCLVFELLSMSLYDFIKANKFNGVSLGLIRRFAIQLLSTLRFLRRHHIVHCDLKPENILLQDPGKSAVKVIDFGSSCLENEKVFTYIQSRFYRSPEVLLGLSYKCAIDMWSLGCILAELYTGWPLFPGEDEVEQMACLTEVLGLPPRRLLEESHRRKVFFDGTGSPRAGANSKCRKRRPASKDIMSAIKCNDVRFVSFLEGCLRWDCGDRFTPEEALEHDWILEGIAQQTAGPPQTPRADRRVQPPAAFEPPLSEPPRAEPPRAEASKAELAALGAHERAQRIGMAIPALPRIPDP